MINYEQLNDPDFRIPLSYFITKPIKYETPEAKRKRIKQQYRRQFGANWRQEWKKYNNAHAWHEYKAKTVKKLCTDYISYLRTETVIDELTSSLAKISLV